MEFDSPNQKNNMIQSRPIRPNSIILTDWGAFASVYQSPVKLVSDLIVLSLLYDEILIQDEVFVLSDLMPAWFADSEGSSLLAKIFDLDSVVLLGWKSYPKDITVDPKLYPMLARAEFHKKYSTQGDQLFIPNEENIKFYKKVEYSILNRQSALRERGSKNTLDVYSSFLHIFKELLTAKIYEAWMSSLFPSITKEIKDEILSFIENPCKAVEDLQNNGHDVRTVIEGGNTVFNRSLGFQISKLYNTEVRSSLQRLIQSSYAIPLCESEEAVGRYGNLLKEVPWHSSKEVAQQQLSEDKVSVEIELNTELSIPNLFSDFPKVINSVRETEAGILLREAMREVGDDIDFSNIREHWNAVANELARFSEPNMKMTAKTTALRIGEKLFIGTVLGEVGNMAFGILPVPGLGAMLGAGVGLAFDHGHNLMKKELQHQKIREQIESFVDFRCSWIPFKK
jgi:hypothetical protein